MEIAKQNYLIIENRSVNVQDHNSLEGSKAQPVNYLLFKDFYKDLVGIAATYNANKLNNICLNLMSKGEASKKKNYKFLHKSISDTNKPKKIIESPILDLLNKPSSYSNFVELNYKKWLDLQLTGNAYWFLDKPKKPTLIWGLPSHMVQIFLKNEDYFDSFAKQNEEYNFQREKKIETLDYNSYKKMFQEKGVSFDEESSYNPVAGYLYGSMGQYIAIPEDQVIHFKLPCSGNRRDYFGWYGVGMIEKAWANIQLYEAQTASDISFYRNNARPDYVITIEGNDMSPEQVSSLANSFMQNNQGVLNTGKPKVINAPSGAKVTITPLTFAPKDQTGRQQVVSAVAAQFGVPINVLNGQPLAGGQAETYEISHLRDLVDPLLKLDAAKLNEKLITKFPQSDSLYFEYETAAISDRIKELAIVEKESKYMTVNEIREKYLGLPPIVGGDVLSGEKVSIEDYNSNKDKTKVSETQETSDVKDRKDDLQELRETE